MVRTTAGVEVVTTAAGGLGGVTVWLFLLGFALAVTVLVRMPYGRKALRPGPFLVLFLLGFALAVTAVVLDGHIDTQVEVVNEHYGIELTSLPRPGEEHTFVHGTHRLTVLWDQGGTRVVVLDGTTEYRP